MQSPQSRSIEPDATQLAAPRWASRLLDDPHAWGSFSATVGRYGARYYRLVIYPPETTTADRRLARLWRGWPISGAVLGLCTLMVLSSAITSAGAALEVFVIAYVGSGALLFWWAGSQSVPVRSMSIIRLPDAPGEDADEQHRSDEWHHLVRMLTKAEAMLTAGEISAAEYKATWQHAYYCLGTPERA